MCVLWLAHTTHGTMLDTNASQERCIGIEKSLRFANLVTYAQVYQKDFMAIR
jgi:hypothetical protein